MNPAWWFVFHNNNLLVTFEGDVARIPPADRIAELGIQVSAERRIGTVRGQPCYAALVEDEMAPTTGATFVGLRTLFGRIEDEFFQIALTAAHMTGWDKTSRYCGCCGSETTYREGLKAKECNCCKQLTFPRISPAVIVLVEKGDEVLLARSSRFINNMYSVLAGFVEPGESLEETVYREVREEVGIEVKDIRYFASQPWPFPDSLMVAFTAVHHQGDILIDGNEIVEAAWFEWNRLPSIPGKISIARRLIDWFVEKHSSVMAVSEK
jgi:NAD+ diphosphatase